MSDEPTYPEEERHQAPWFQEGGFVLPPRITPCPAMVIATEPAKIRGLIERFGEYYVARAYWEREERIRLAEIDPLNHGFELPWWSRVDEQWADASFLILLAGNGAGKTRFMSKRVVEYALKYPGCRIWCFSQTEAVSNELQQPFVHDYIPPAVKKLRKTKVTNITYSEKAGFTENSLVFPNKSKIMFKFYAQGVGTLEGPGVDLIWFDEEAPLPFIETARFRLSRAVAIWPDGGKMILTFTPIDGYTATIKSFVAGAKTIKEVEAPLLEREKDGVKVPEMVPTLQKSIKGYPLVYAHTSENPFINYDRMVREEFANLSREDILIRAYGVAKKSIGVMFPRFRDAVHVRPRDEIYDMLRAAEHVTWYHSVDPCPGRNWFQGWLACVPGWTILVREHPQEDDWIPDIGFVGPWTIPSEKPDGKAGPGQKKWGFGYHEYLNEVKRVEDELAEALGFPVKIMERIMDSRAAAGPANAKHGTTTFIDEVNDTIEETYDELRIFPDFSPAQATRGVHNSEIKEGCEMINNALTWNQGAPVNQLNHPEFIINADCKNTIYTLSEFTGKDGPAGACKDPADMLRIAYVKQAEFVDEDAMQSTGGGSY